MQQEIRVCFYSEMAHEVDISCNLKIISPFQLSELQGKLKTMKTNECFIQLPAEESKCNLYKKGVLEVDPGSSDKQAGC